MEEIKKQVYDHLMQLQHILQRHQMHNFRNIDGFRDPRRGQGRILSILKLKPEISQKELGYLLDMSKQALAELLSKLEKSGLIVREASVEDRRVLNVRLTTEGAEAAEKMEDGAPDRAEVFDCLKEEELKALDSYLCRVLENFKEQYGKSDDRFEERRRAFQERFGRGEGGERFAGRFGHSFGFGREEDANDGSKQ